MQPCTKLTLMDKFYNRLLSEIAGTRSGAKALTNYTKRYGPVNENFKKNFFYIDCLGRFNIDALLDLAPVALPDGFTGEKGDVLLRLVLAFFSDDEYMFSFRDGSIHVDIEFSSSVEQRGPGKIMITRRKACLKLDNMSYSDVRIMAKIILESILEIMVFLYNNEDKQYNVIQNVYFSQKLGCLERKIAKHI